MTIPAADIERTADRPRRDPAGVGIMPGFETHIVQGGFARHEKAAAAAVLLDRNPMTLVVLTDEIDGMGREGVRVVHERSSAFHCLAVWFTATRRAAVASCTGAA